MQMHFNLAGKTVDDVIDGDQTQLAMWTLDEGETPNISISLMPVVDLGINIPPNEPAWTEESFRRLPLDATIIGTAPHMHPRPGKSIKMELIRRRERRMPHPSGRLGFRLATHLHVPRDPHAAVSINDQIRLECTYDNSGANQPIIAGEKQTPQQTEWGDGTRDEMCLDYLVLAHMSGESTDDCRASRSHDDCPKTMLSVPWPARAPWGFSA